MPSPDRGESLKNDVPVKVPETASPSPIEEATHELRDALSGILMFCQGKQSTIKNGDDFRERLNEVENQTSKEQIILLQIYRAFNQAQTKQALLPIICDLASILLEAFKNPDIRPTLSESLAGLSPEILIQIASEKHQEKNKIDLKINAAEILGYMSPIRLKTFDEVKSEINNVPNTSPEEKKILETLVEAAKGEPDNSIFILTGRILTAFHHAENRSIIAESLEGITTEELRKMAEEMLSPKRSPSGRIAMEQVKKLFQPKQEPRKISTKSTPRPAQAIGSDEQSIDSPRGKEEVVTRKFATRTITAVLNSGHLSLEMDKLTKEKIISPENDSYKLLGKILERLKEVESVKETSKDPNERKNRLKTAIKDFAGKIIYTLKKSDKQKNIDRFRILSKILKHMANLLDLIALILTLKRVEDIKIVEEEIKSHRQTLSRWTDEDSRHLARARIYFENGEKSLEKIEDEEKSEMRQDRLRNAMVDFSSLIVIGLSTPIKEKELPGFKSKTEYLLRQIEVDAQGLEISNLHDDDAVVAKTEAHVAERKMDEAEQDRVREALSVAKELGLEKGLKVANEREKELANHAVREAGLIDFSGVEDLLSQLGD